MTVVGCCAAAMLLVPVPAAAAGVVAAFPGAEGAGALATGGRGGAVHAVTNLEDAGPGSLRACVAAAGPRTCVFRVGGTISLRTPLRITKPYLTVAGQTAPGGGIQIVGPFSTGDAASPTNDAGASSIVISSHDVIVRYLRIRHGLVRGDLCAGTSCSWEACRAGDRQGGACLVRGKPDNVSLAPDRTATGIVRNVILDHVSSEWAEGKAFGAWNNAGEARLRDVTIQWSLAAETLRGHSTAFIVGSDNPGCERTRAISNSITDLDWHHNLSMSSSHRHPLIKAKRARFVNNLVYNWGLYATQIGGGAEVDVIGNVYRRGPMTGAAHEIEVFPSIGNTETASGDPSLHVAGNVVRDGARTEIAGWGRMTYAIMSENGSESAPGAGILDGTRYRRPQPLAPAGVPITVEAGAGLEETVLANVGASSRLDCAGHWLDARDALDRRLVEEYRNRRGPRSAATDCAGSGCIPQSEIDSPEGRFPVLSGGPPCLDSDGDGIPDTWELAHGLDPHDPRDGPKLQPDGYSNLEHYLNGSGR